MTEREHQPDAMIGHEVDPIQAPPTLLPPNLSQQKAPGLID